MFLMPCGLSKVAFRINLVVERDAVIETSAEAIEAGETKRAGGRQ
jgi:hypothetical protein